MALPETYRPNPHWYGQPGSFNGIMQGTYDGRADANNKSVDDRQGNFAGRGEITAPVEMQPVDATKADCTS